MKLTVFFLLSFVIGIFCGRIFSLPTVSGYKEILLILLLFFVGIQIGSDKKNFEFLKNINLRILLFPIFSFLGSIFFLFLISFLIKFPLKEGISIGAGMGYYSITSILISEFKNEYFGTIALITNLLREIETLIFAPLLVKLFGNFSPVASGGATTVDTTLPVILKFSGKELLVLAVLNGVILTVIVPFFITIIYSI